MTDRPERPHQLLQDPLSGSCDLNRSALGATDRGSKSVRLRTNGDALPAAALLSERVRAVRESLAHVQPAPASARTRIKEAGSRLGVALAALPSEERRRFARWPLVRPCLLTLRGMRLRASTLDIGAGGVMLAPLPMLGPGDVAATTLELCPGDKMPSILTIDRDGLGHLAFDGMLRGQLFGLRNLLKSCAASYNPLLWRVARLAGDVQALFEAALRGRALPLRALLTSDSEHPEVVRLFEDGLAALLAESIAADRDLAYVAAIDRRGCVAAACAGPDLVPTRRGHCIQDAVTLRATRFATAPIIQTYRLQPGREPEGVVGDASAPVFIRGRRWGCVRIGRNPASFDEG